MTTTLQNPIHIEISDDESDRNQEWDEKQWIGVGKNYPVSGEVPTFIEAARAKVLALPPPIYSSYIPNLKVSIIDLLKTKLPVQSSALITYSAAGAFSKGEPNEDMACLKMRPIPQKAWLEQLEKDFGQAWFNGTRSIEDKRYKNSRLPLFALTYWKEMRIVVEKRAIWQAADEWLARRGKSGEVEEADRAREMMSCLTWGFDITALGASCPKRKLAILLSDNWIDDDIINMMMFYLAAQVRLDAELQKTTVVAALNLQLHINRAYKTGDYSKASVPLLCRYTELFKEKKRTYLYFPAHIGGNHWVPFFIDFKTETIRHG